MEEAFDKAEYHLITIFNGMLSQKKLAEDVRFEGKDFARVVEAFSNVYQGSDQFYNKCEEVLSRFKYALSEEDIIRIFYSYIQMKKTPPQVVLDLAKDIKGENLSSLKHKFEYIKGILKEESTELGYVTDRKDIKSEFKPRVAS